MPHVARCFVASTLLVVQVFFSTGCNDSRVDFEIKPHAGLSPMADNRQNQPTETADHAHKQASHGGLIIPIGANSYHAEAVVEKDGTVRLLTLGKDETRIQEVDVQKLTAYVKVSGESDAVAIDLHAKAQEGDTSGRTSQFVGSLPTSAKGKSIDVTIPNLRIAGERFRLAFTTSSPDHQHSSGMPTGVTGDAEQKLYFTPGGKYSQADIDANGKQTASQKYKGKMSKHDMYPKPGDAICPVTFTKANAQFEWVVGGKSYLFCCPPCIDEFVRLAKEEPDALKLPDEYVMGNGGSKFEKEKLPVTDPEEAEIAEALAALTEEDRALAISQKYCVVMTDSPLGSMGTPIKVEVDGAVVFLCCAGCKSAALRAPQETIEKLTELRKANQVIR